MAASTHIARFHYKLDNEIIFVESDAYDLNLFSRWNHDCFEERPNHPFIAGSKAVKKREGKIKAPQKNAQANEPSEIGKRWPTKVLIGARQQS